jgi:pSer/pThr/pTyr-binding forkhead associated (FHA) protein
MWKLTIQDDQGTPPVVVHFVRDEYTIGRDEGNAVRLTERNISRHHARMQRLGNDWRLQDLGSYNGCYVNGARVAETQALQHGDLIQLGDYRLSIEDEAVGTGRTDGVLTLPGRPGINTQADRLVMMAGPGQGQEFVLNAERMVLGRGEECDISINHPSVSRVHAEIRRVGESRYEFVDLGSANGIRVNGAEMPSTLLDGRDVIELGDVFLKFLPAGEIYIAGAEEPSRAPASTPPPGVSTTTKVALGLVVAVVAVVIGLALRGTEPPPAPLAPAGGDRLTQTLKDARALLKQGDSEAAMLKASTIPADSNLRESQDFKAILDAWADGLFNRALATQDPAEKRSALERIASSPSVDPARRKRAADEIEAMQRPAVNVADLPSDDMTIEQTQKAPEPEAARSAAPTAAPAVTHAAVPKPTPKPATLPTKSATAAPKPEKSPALVRKNPFDDE